MSTLSIRLPESVHRKLKQMADKEGVSMNQLISLAVSEKLSSLLTVDYLNERAEQANAKDYKKLLAKVPNTEPDPYDKFIGLRHFENDELAMVNSCQLAK